MHTVRSAVEGSAIFCPCGIQIKKHPKRIPLRGTASGRFSVLCTEKVKFTGRREVGQRLQRQTAVPGATPDR